MKHIVWICLVALPILVFPCKKELGRNNHDLANTLLHSETFLTSFIKEGELYLNIPRQILDKPMLFVRYDSSYLRKYMQVTWSLEGDRILLKVPRIRSSAGTILPLKQKRSLKENILAVFPVEKEYAKSGSLCIRITDLILHQVIEWTPGYSENLVPQITLLLGAKDLGKEVIIKTRRGVVNDGSKVSVPVHYGFCALPEHMKGRAYDYRMGFSNEEFGGIDYDNAKNSVANISRWRLEKRHKDLDISVPVKPITFVLSPKIPKKWRPYVKAGIEEWLPAFESAGFKDALVVKEVNSLTDWQIYSLNTSVVHWGDAKYLRGFDDAGGTISHIVDFRSGEILKCDIHLGASRDNLAERYFIRCAPLDKRAQKFPFPDDLIGKLIQALAAHETGHAFGIVDSNFGEYAYPYDKMNDSTWLKTMGHSPSIMNYARENNIAQPEDSIPTYLLVPKVGPMDRYHINWAYREFPLDMSKERQDVELETLIRMQDSIPWLRYNNGKFEVIGPAATDEVVETRNPIESTKLALMNLERVVGLLPSAVQDQKDNARLERLYGKTLELWYRHMRHVLSLIGGYDIQYKSINQPGKMYMPIALGDQEEALEFLMANAFDPPDWLVQPAFGPKLNYSTYPDQVLEYQQRLVLELLRTQRFKRFEYMETLEGYGTVYKRFLERLQQGLFKEIYDGSNRVGRRRQELQFFYIDMLLLVMNRGETKIAASEKDFAYTAYSKGLLMGQLKTLQEDIGRNIKSYQGTDLGHWKLCLFKLDSL
jgi:hypothetical protein